MEKIKYIDVNDINDIEFDSIIDVRSPIEFSEDHISGAINLPALSDLERGEVGTIYKQLSPFEARKVGGALIAENIATHMKKVLAKNKKNWKPLIYCWRGGQRSKAFATVLGEVGWDVSIIKGGYKAYRKMLYKFLYEDDIEHRLYLISGNTGTAKTQILQILENEGQNIIDLERLAKHRGSVFGSLKDRQPTQKLFESALYRKINQFDLNEPIILEAESNKIGNISVPASLWKRMKLSKRIVITAPVKVRAQYLKQEYIDLINHKERFIKKLKSLKYIQGVERINRWCSLFEGREYLELAEELINYHYDPRYQQSAKRNGDLEVKVIRLEKLGIEDLSEAVKTIQGYISLVSNL